MKSTEGMWPFIRARIPVCGQYALHLTHEVIAVDLQAHSDRVFSIDPMLSPVECTSLIADAERYGQLLQ